MRVSNRNRRGLSVIESVVAAALIVLLAVLVLPAVERARGSAVRNRTQDNMRQIGLGMYAYHAAQNSFPK
ncbi:MAG TPA: DUF1559 domain-containing protein [Planctomycetaceae bacterium]|jgi:type II secretory pathway pseudopilin PulG